MIWVEGVAVVAAAAVAMRTVEVGVVMVWVVAVGSQAVIMVLEVAGFKLDTGGTVRQWQWNTYENNVLQHYHM